MIEKLLEPSDSISAKMNEIIDCLNNLLKNLKNLDDDDDDVITKADLTRFLCDLIEFSIKEK